MNKENFFNLIDFGSSKVRFSVFDYESNKKFSESRNVSINTNYTDHFKVINEVVKKAEKSISYHVNDVIILLDSSDLFTIDVSLKKNLNKKSQIFKVYDSLILELNQLINSYYSNYYLAHIIINKCLFDDKSNDGLPKNQTIYKYLKVDFKILCFPKKLIKHIKSKFIENNLNVINFFCTSYVKSSLYFKKLGLNNGCFLDIGLKRTSLLYYESKKLKYIKSVHLGSFNITKDISKVFNINLEDAEEIKKIFNKSEKEFKFSTMESENNILFKKIIHNKISIDQLKKVILYRVQEIINLTLKKNHIAKYDNSLHDTELFTIGRGSAIFRSNFFNQNDEFFFKSISFFPEIDSQICNSGLIHYLNSYETPKITRKKQGIFEKFFNFFGK